MSDLRGLLYREVKRLGDVPKKVLEAEAKALDRHPEPHDVRWKGMSRGELMAFILRETLEKRDGA